MTKHINTYKLDPILGPAFKKYRHHAAHAKARGVDFLFTFEEWWAWWQVDDRWSRRGNRASGIVMARTGDAGPYSPSNVRPLTHTENGRDKNRGKTTYRGPRPFKSRACGRQRISG